MATRAAAFGQSWQVHPNTLQLDVPRLPAQHLEARLFDATGRPVHRQDLSGAMGQPGKTLELPSTLAPGVYHLQLVANHQATEVKRIVKLP